MHLWLQPKPVHLQPEHLAPSVTVHLWLQPKLVHLQPVQLARTVHLRLHPKLERLQPERVRCFIVSLPYFTQPLCVSEYASGYASDCASE